VKTTAVFIARQKTPNQWSNSLHARGRRWFHLQGRRVGVRGGAVAPGGHPGGGTFALAIPLFFSV